MLEAAIAALLLVCVVSSSPAASTAGSKAQPAAAMPVRVGGTWTVDVGPGTVTLDGRRITLPRQHTVSVRPPTVISVRDERCEALPPFRPNEGAWQIGVRLRQVTPLDCGGDALVIPGSVRVKPAAGDSPAYVADQDYDMNAFWSAVGRLEGGSVPPESPVFLDYDYSPLRLDSIVVNAHGDVYLVEGKPVMDAVQPPSLLAGETAVANVWLGGRVDRLTEENLFPIGEASASENRGEPVAESLLPKTLAKLRGGREVTIVAWGDSVTNGGGVSTPSEENRHLWYQSLFAQRLQARFPKARIKMLTASWGGSISKNYFDARSGEAHDFVRDVITPKPDLVIAEWVNDTYLDESSLGSQYARYLEEIRGNGSEVILIAPHLVNPRFMGCSTLKIDKDPRPYVAALKQFAREKGVAVADVSAVWLGLQHKGLPFTALSNNAHNHPDARGHRLFADTLMGLFPDR
jgi:lysophospholipase L1-like esterase